MPESLSNGRRFGAPTTVEWIFTPRQEFSIASVIFDQFSEEGQVKFRRLILLTKSVMADDSWERSCLELLLRVASDAPPILIPSPKI
jgi:hypothetical protein